MANLTSSAPPGSGIVFFARIYRRKRKRNFDKLIHPTFTGITDISGKPVIPVISVITVVYHSGMGVVSPREKKIDFHA